MTDKYRKMDARELGIYFRETGGDPRFLTADGVSIHHHMVLWNNELRACRVDFHRTGFGEHWDGWFDCEVQVPGTIEWVKGPIMNGERLAFRFEGNRPVL